MFTQHTTGAFVAGVVSFVLDPKPSETAADIATRITPLVKGVLVSDLTEAEVATLEAAALFDVVLSDGMGHITLNAEVAAKKAAAAKAKPPIKRMTADERRDKQVKSGELKFLKDKASMNIVKKLFTQYVGAEDDFGHFATFFRELDQMIGEYRIHAGIDSAEPLEMGDDEEEADDYNPDEIVATAASELAGLESIEREIAANEHGKPAVGSIVAVRYNEDGKLSIIPHGLIAKGPDGVSLVEAA